MAISLIPLILTIVLIIYIIRSAALMRLLTSLDADTLQKLRIEKKKKMLRLEMR
jgi:hypothetical protein